MALNKTYGTILYDGEVGSWRITQAEPHICIKLKAVFTGIARWKTFPFVFMDSPETCHDLEWFMQRYPLAVSEKDLARIKREKRKYINTLNELEAISVPDYKPVNVLLKDGWKARDYQLKGKDIAMKQQRILIGDEVGLGKTLIGILACMEKGTLPACIVVQTHLTHQWKNEIEKFTNLTVHIIQGTKPYSLPEADVYILKYSCLSGWVDVFKKNIFNMAVFDEAQELRHDTSAKYQAATTLSNSVYFCIGLTATPIYNYGDEIYNVLHLIKPNCLGWKDSFMREWGDGRSSVHEAKALGTYLRDNFLFLRRTREEVGRELPIINTLVHTVGYSEDEMQKAEELTEQLAIKVIHGSFMERGQAARELDMLMRMNTGVAKAREVAAYVKILLENNEPALLAGWHRAVYDIWLEELAEFNPMLYTGSESTAKKEETKKAFISGETNLMIISLRSGIGLDGLQQRCKTVVIGELDWSPQVHNQLIGRLDRDGQPEQVTAIYLVCEAGSDPPIIDMLGIKSSQAHNIIDPLKAVAEKHSDSSRIKILAERFLQNRKLKRTEASKGKFILNPE